MLSMFFFQASRERLDSLSALAKSSTESRAALASRVDGLDSERRQCEIATAKRLNDLEVLTRSKLGVAL